MNRVAALRQLSVSYAVAIRLRDEGLSDHVIAVALEVDDDQVPALLDIAGAKLANVLTRESSPPVVPGTSTPSGT